MSHDSSSAGFKYARDKLGEPDRGADCSISCVVGNRDADHEPSEFAARNGCSLEVKLANA